MTDKTTTPAQPSADHLINRRNLFAWGSAAATMVAFAGGSAAFADDAVPVVQTTTGQPVVQTTAGQYAGEIEHGVLVFRGVPYGASTAGVNRFLPPVKPASWSGIRTAPKGRVIAPQTDPTPQPPRPHSPFDAILGGLSMADAVESEDCLSLNIWTPALDDAKRPVMVWLHGGGFGIGAGSLPAYDGARLAQTGDVVVMNVTHRLGVLGYLNLADFGGDEFAASSVAGMLDIVLALEWVRDNIERVGGDPGRVMIFGESGGGAKTGCLMTMPQAQGLFHRAAIQSGAMRRVMERPEATRLAAALMAALGLRTDQVKELQALPRDKLMAANFAMLRKSGMSPMMGFAPMVDGVVLPQQPFDPVASPLSASIPLLIGSNAFEGTLFAQGDLPAFNLDEPALHARLVDLMGVMTGNAALVLYKSIYPSYSPSDLYFKITTDRGIGASTTRVAELKTGQGGAPVYLYQFHFSTLAMNGMLRCPHGLDVPMIFNDPTSPTNRILTGGGQRTLDMAAVMSAAWVAFARTGNPGTPATPWPAYNVSLAPGAAQRPTIIFDTQTTVVDDPHRELREFWMNASERFI